MKSCFQNVLDKQQRQLVLISGYSGTGKSALASVLLESTSVNNLSRKGLYAKGKFYIHYNNNTEPYSGIAMACREICGSILGLAVENKKDHEKLQKNITSTLGSELPMLFK